jgi:EAL domain-containing protein (putative c-di-GMP-specific phosphodiesterase class I)
VHTVAEALEFSRLPAEALHLELTENRALHDVATEIARMHALRALGVQVHIDDFGSGFAQLGWLARLPVDVIKIDRSLVTGLQASQRKRDVVHGIVDLAKRLDIGLVAEGVETRAELDCLRAAGIRYGQGYLFSPPVPAPRASVFAGQDLRAMAV